MEKNTLHRSKSGLFSQFSNELVYNQSQFSSLITQPFSIEAFEAQIQTKSTHFTSTSRTVLQRALLNQYQQLATSEAVTINLKKLGDSNTFTVTTGHQLNLFTGPVYFLYKIIHVIQLAEILNKKYPENHFVPVYWMATEDHDFEEINHTRMFNSTIRWDEPQGGAVGNYALTHWEELLASVEKYFDNNPTAEVLEILQSYTGATLAEATFSLVNRLFGVKGLLIIEPNQAVLKQQFSEYMQLEVKTSFAQKAINAADQHLGKIGYKPQVFAREINLFYLAKGMRSRLALENDSIQIEGLGTFTREEVLEMIVQHPENFSPNVAMRTLYQETILPNLAYIGGGGEIAYWMQFKGIFDAVGVPYPLVQVRNSLQLIDRNSAKKMQKLAWDYKVLFEDINQVKKQYVLEHSGEALNFDKLNQLASQISEEIATKSNEVDVNLNTFAAAENTRFAKQIEAIKAKLAKQQKVKFDAVIQQMEDLHEKLFPQGGVQERKENFLNFCATGNVSSFIQQLFDAIDPLENDLIIVNLD